MIPYCTVLVSFVLEVGTNIIPTESGKIERLVQYVGSRVPLHSEHSAELKRRALPSQLKPNSDRAATHMEQHGIPQKNGEKKIT